MQQNNSFSLRQNRFTNRIKIQEKWYNCLQYKKYFKSVHEENEMFTSYVKTMGSEKYKELKDIYKSFLNNEDVLGKKFQADELIYNDSKITRLFNIIYENTGIKLTRIDVPKIYKFKYNEDDEVQFYFYLNNGVLNLYLVDIYHLGIVAKKDGKYRWKEKYKSKRAFRLNISKIKEQR